MNSHWLTERWRSFEEKPAIIWNNEEVKYSDLLTQVNDWLNIIKNREISPGKVVAIDGDCNPHSLALLVALIINKNIIVPLSPSVDKQKATFIEIAAVNHIIEIDSIGAYSITEGLATDPSLNVLFAKLIENDDPGLILFSSGSTGASKASVLNFSKILDRFTKARKPFSTIAFLMFDHIGGINTILSTLASGGTVVPITDRIPTSVCQLIETHKVQLLPTSPTFLNMLLISRAYASYDLSSLELITYGTEPMPASTLRHLNECLPKAKLKQTYGLSEVGILSTQSKDSSSLWMKIGGEGYDIKVVDDVLWIKSDSAMLGYLNADSPFDDDGWLNTRDKVEVEGDYFRILGRDTDIINVGGEKVYAAEVESVILEMENISDVAVSGRKNPLTGQVVFATVSLIEDENIRDLTRRIKKHCKTILAGYKVPAYIEVSDSAFHSARFKKQKSKVQSVAIES